MADLDLEPDIRNSSRDQPTTRAPPPAGAHQSSDESHDLGLQRLQSHTTTPSAAPSIFLNHPQHALSVDQHAHFEDEAEPHGHHEDEKAGYSLDGFGHHPLVTSIQSVATRSNPELGSPELKAQRNVHAARRRPMPVLHLDEPALRLGGVGPPRPPKSFAQVLKPERKLAKDPTWATSFKNAVTYSWVNYMLVFIPISWALHFSHQGSVIIFIFSMFAVVPLAALLGFATEQLALRVGDALGGLLNATFGNAVELLIAILALRKGEIDLVQASMIGSVLSNTLLVLGMSYFAGGLRFHEQLYAQNGAQMHISLLGISLIAIVLPAAYHYAWPQSLPAAEAARYGNVVPEGEELANLLKMSRGLSFILLSVYAMYLVFTLWTHSYLFKIRRVRQIHPLTDGPAPPSERVFPRPSWVPSIADSDSTHSTEEPSRFRRMRRFSRSSPTPTQDPEADAASISSIDSDDEEEVPLVKFWFAAGMLVVVTAITGVTAEWLLDSIDGLTATGNVSREFVGLILLPVIGNSVEHITAVTVSVKDKLNLSMSIAVGSSIQVSLALLPVLVLIGWAIGQPMMLFFDQFETITIVISVLLVNFAISDGRTNYLEGFILMCAYISIAMVCWFYDPIH